MHTTNTLVLESQIEHLVRAHVAAIQRAVASAVERACGQASGAAPKGRPQRSSASSERTPGRRRTAVELQALSERLHEAICATPGASMSELAARVEATPRELNQPAQVLRRAGRMRSVGQRSATRYYPRNPKTGANA